MDAIGNKKDSEWKRLRKQRIAYEARLRNRMSKSKRNDQIQQMDLVIENVISMALQLCPSDNLKALKSDLSSHIPK